MPEERERKFGKDFLDKWERAEREESPAEALAAVDEALRGNPNDAKLWFRRGTLLLDLARWTEALDSFARVEALAPTFPLLNLAKSFVLNKLGRTQEAAEAQRKALLDVAAGVDEGLAKAIEKPEGVEAALAALAEDLRKQAEKTAAEERELPTPATIPGEEDPATKLARWTAQGYDTTPLREILDKDPDRARTAFFQFEQNVKKVEVLRETLRALDPDGLEAEIARVRGLFRAPYQIWRVEAELATLLEKAEERDRRRRAIVAPSPGGPPPRPREGIRPEPLGPGRVNGLVNGTRRPGMTNGLVNGTRGRTNGLVNGLQRARTGMTNGLTNGTGFTNGLGSRRFARETRTGWTRLLLVPLTAILLLAYPFFAPSEAPAGIVVDGGFADWAGVRGYVQNSSTTDANVDIQEYRVSYEPPRLSVYVRTRGVVFGNPSAIDLVDVFVDADGNRTTGYDEGRLGADLHMIVSGWNETISNVQVQEWGGGGDRDNWTAWQGAPVSGNAAAKGSELEVQLDLGGYARFDKSKAAISVHAEDQSHSSSRTGLLAGTDYGALRVEQRAAATELSSGGNFVVLEFTAIGGPVRVTNVSFSLKAGTPWPTGFPLQLDLTEENPSNTTLLTVNATALAPGALLVADVANVTASRPATIAGDPVRAYVAPAPSPSEKIVDGLFSDWAPADFIDDASNDVPNPNVDLRHFASETQGTASFVFVEVGGVAMEGSPSPQRYLIPPPPGSGGTPPPPTVPVRKTGEDVALVYFDRNTTNEGVPTRGIIADTCLEVHGTNGRVRSARAYVWNDTRDRWDRTGGSEAIAVGARLEASLTIPGVDLRGARFVVVAMDWKGTTDDTTVHGVRGTRSDASGHSFQNSYEATLPLAADGLVRFRAPGGCALSWRLPEVKILGPDREITLGGVRASPFVREGYGGSYRNVYDALEADVVYEARADLLKETIVLSREPDLQTGENLLLEASIAREGGLLVRVTGGETNLGFLVAGDIEYVDGFATSLTLSAPWAEDADGRRTTLRFRLEGDRVGVLVPAPWLAGAAYPVVIDPSVTFTLHNNGPSDDDGENLGYSVAVGDFNGDGRADVLTGAPNNDRGGTMHGFAYVFYGPFAADDSTPSVWIDGTTPDAQFGFSVAAGRFNGDIYWDALVSRRSLAGAWMGNVSIYYGSNTWIGYEATPDIEFTPPANPANFGWYVASGNVDGASNDDVLIGEPGRDNDGGDASSDGRVYVYKSPFAAVEGSADYELFPSTNATGNFGTAIATGLIDNDAYADVIVGEPATLGGGRVHFFKGSTMVSGSGNRYPAATLSARKTQEDFGAALDAGKLNGDNYEDVVVGAPRNGMGAGLGPDGVAYIFLANGDGSGLTTGALPGYTLTNQSNDERFGTAVLIIDYTRDNTADVLVGAPYALFGGQTRGNVHWFNNPLVDQVVDETINGAQNNERFGRCLAGDRFSNNPLAVVAIGAYLWDDSAGDNDGRVVVATVPEPALILIGTVAVLGLVSLQRRRLFRKR